MHLHAQLERLRQTTEEKTRSVERRLETLIEQEWSALKEIHEQPVRELREHAASLTEVCIATARAAQNGFDRAEARLASFEDDFHRRLTEVTRELQAAIAETRTPPEQPSRADHAAPWAFEDVTRLHSQLRELNSAAPRLETLAVAARPGVVALPPGNGGDGTVADLTRGVSWRSRAVLAGLAVALVATGGLGWSLRNQVQATAERAREAELKLQQTAADAARDAAAARAEAERQISSARQMADRAERIGNVLAAPDLVRYALSGRSAAPAASGQALWSRTRGLVFSGSRIPPPPAGGVHQLWLLTRAAAVKASSFVPAPDGTVTVLVADLAPGAVVGVMITAEPTAAAATPSGDLVLSSVPGGE